MMWRTGLVPSYLRPTAFSAPWTCSRTCGLSAMYRLVLASVV